jgi:hypothetical protein
LFVNGKLYQVPTLGAAIALVESFASELENSVDEGSTTPANYSRMITRKEIEKRASACLARNFSECILWQCFAVFRTRLRIRNQRSGSRSILIRSDRLPYLLVLSSPDRFTKREPG